MKTINLVYPDKSEILYKIQRFPDGQQNVVILTTELGRYSKYNEYIYDKIQPVQIKSRLNNWLDLEIIIATVASLRKLGIKEIHLYIPYLLGARSDRQFEDGSNSYLVDVLSPILNSLNLESITVMDVHSDVASACIKNLKTLDNWKIVDFFFEHNLNDDGYLLVSPDAGALKKIYKIADKLAYKRDIITCSKSRDENGKLTKTIVPVNATMLGKDFIIIDDICDGGATFINIAKEIKKWDTTNSSKIYLIITHGIFSKGFEELSLYFDDIYCTNSYKDINPMGTAKHTKFVKQLNIFI